jgi:excisionase family DNA binding protein
MKTITISIEEYNRLREHKPNMETLQFIQMNPKDFKNEIINGILEIMAKPKEEEVLLTQKEVADFYRVSKATIIKWQKEGKIKAYSIDNERRYKKSELLDNLVLMK